MSVEMLQKLTMELREAMVPWQMVVRQFGGPQMTDDVIADMARKACLESMKMERERATARKAIVAESKLPDGVSSLDARRAKSAGWTAANTADDEQKLVDELLDTESLGRLAEATKSEPRKLLLEVFARGIDVLSREHGLK